MPATVAMPVLPAAGSRAAQPLSPALSHDFTSDLNTVQPFSLAAKALIHSVPLTWSASGLLPESEQTRTQSRSRSQLRESARRQTTRTKGTMPPLRTNLQSTCSRNGASKHCAAEHSHICQQVLCKVRAALVCTK
eukprot:158827-Rhodomonas_salina.6